MVVSLSIPCKQGTRITRGPLFLLCLINLFFVLHENFFEPIFVYILAFSPLNKGHSKSNFVAYKYANLGSCAFFSFLCPCSVCRLWKVVNLLFYSYFMSPEKSTSLYLKKSEILFFQ